MTHRCKQGCEWGGLLTCHCSRCHRTFSAIDPFDRHVGTRGCLDPATAVDRDGEPMFMETTRKRVGTVWTRYRDEENFPDPGDDDDEEAA